MTLGNRQPAPPPRPLPVRGLARDAARTGIGQSVRRVEDGRFLTGQGRFTDDVQLPGLLHGVTLRAPHAHAEIRAIDTTAARAMPGVRAIYTGADVAHYGPLPCYFGVEGSIETPHTLLKQHRVRFVGDGVAFVVAETADQARAAARAIVVDYAPLPHVVDMPAALAPDAPVIWADAGSNRLFEWNAGQPERTDSAIRTAHHVTRLNGILQNKIAPSSLEVRAAVGDWDAEHGFTLYAGTQGVVDTRSALADDVLRCPRDQLRVITPDVGGGFGMRCYPYPEYALVLHAARDLGRPVKWTGSRTDAFLTDTHGRATASNAELAFDADGRIVAFRAETFSDLGAYQSQFGPAVQTTAGGRIMGGVYRIPAMHNRVYGVATNTAPVDAYRGAGRPESTYLIERMMDQAARELGICPAELRRKNLLRPADLPHDNGLGLKVDCGDFPTLLEKTLARADWDGFAARKAEAQARGHRYGRSVCYYVEVAGGGWIDEFADIRISADGQIEVAVGTQSNGQGHETAYAQVVAQKLGVPMDQVRITQGDTRRLDQGSGTGGARSMAWGGAACLLVVEEMLVRGQAIAARELGDDVSYADGLFRAQTSNRTLSLGEIARQFPKALDGRARYAPADPGPSFPNGCHLAEVEIDPETGRTTVARYVVVDDFGTIVNPLLVLGQIHGGVAQGLGQALLEDVRYDAQGRLVTRDLETYGLPRASDMPREIWFEDHPVPTQSNPLGAKGCGEAGTIGAMPSVINAIIDALDGYALEMPATPEKIWRICRQLSNN